MRELTIMDLDAELAEQLPARELMGGSFAASGNGSGIGNVNVLSGNQVQVAIASPFASNGNFAAAG